MDAKLRMGSVMPHKQMPAVVGLSCLYCWTIGGSCGGVWKMIAPWYIHVVNDNNYFCFSSFLEQLCVGSSLIAFAIKM